MRIVGCFLEYDGKFVIFYRRSHKPDGNTWGLPGGKVEDGEDDISALVRELAEETGYTAHPDEVELLGIYDFITPGDVPFKYVTHRVRLDSPHEVVLEESAHERYEWVSPEECYAKTDLIHGLHELLKMTGYIK
jgi:8-oxo-dGTP pyrophosphatase MutT (NUDIX family)